MIDIALVLNKNNDLCEICLLQERKRIYIFLPDKLTDYVQIGKNYVVRSDEKGSYEFMTRHGGIQYG